MYCPFFSTSLGGKNFTLLAAANYLSDILLAAALVIFPSLGTCFLCRIIEFPPKRKSWLWDCDDYSKVSLWWLAAH